MKDVYSLHPMIAYFITHEEDNSFLKGALGTRTPLWVLDYAFIRA